MPPNSMDLLMYLGGLADVSTIYLIKDMEYQDSEKVKIFLFKCKYRNFFRYIQPFQSLRPF